MKILREITIAKDKGDRLLDGVEEWVANGESHISKAKEVTDGFESNAKKKCLNLGMYINLRTLYHYGKKAANKAPLLLQHQNDGETFESCVSVPTPTPGVLDAYKRHNINDLDTHKLCFKKIRESTKDENICIIGIYGIGDVKRIKKELEVATKRIKNGEKILVILDDVWGELKLDEVGIPYSLQSKEAWILFKRVVRDTVETGENLKIIAKKIVEGCGGLLLIILALGATLKFESIDMFQEDYNIPLERLTHYWVGLAVFKYLDCMEDTGNEVRHAVKILKSTYLLLDEKDEFVGI
ncbi:NB-ARC domains-containing protein [Tanacetum coccineum]